MRSVEEKRCTMGLDTGVLTLQILPTCGL